MKNGHRRNWIMNIRTGKMVKTSKIKLLAFDPSDYDIEGYCKAMKEPKSR